MHSTASAARVASTTEGAAIDDLTPGDILHQVIRPILDRMAGDAGAGQILIGVGTRYEFDSCTLFDRTTGQTGRDKVHVEIDFERPSHLVFDCGFGLHWKIEWERGYRLWARSDDTLMLVPLDPSLRRHITIEDGRLTIADWSAYATLAERAAGCRRADALVAGLLER